MTQRFLDRERAAHALPLGHVPQLRFQLSALKPLGDVPQLRRDVGVSKGAGKRVGKGVSEAVSKAVSKAAGEAVRQQGSR